MMMMNIRKKRLAIAVAGAASLVASTAQAEEFSASATVQNTLAVAVVQNFDLGTLFASVTGESYQDDGVGAMSISPEGSVAIEGASTVGLISLGAPTPAQGSVEMSSDFVLTLPDTQLILEADFDGTANTVKIGDGTVAGVTELVHESSDPDVPSLYLMHFTVGDVSGGVSTLVGGAANDGEYTVEQDFGETTYIFNIGATVTTQPGAALTTAGTSADALPYQEGIYSGTFEVTASY